MHVRYLVGRWEPDPKANRVCLKIDSRATRKFIGFPHLTFNMEDRQPVGVPGERSIGNYGIYVRWDAGMHLRNFVESGYSLVF